jgi:hypothetical protein
MNTLPRSSNRSSKGAALIIVLAFVVLLTGLVLAYFSRTTTDRQLAQSSFNDTSADLLARSALDIVVSDLKQEIINNPTVSTANVQPTPYGTPTPGNTPIPNLIKRSFSGDPTGRTSSVSSTAVSANGRSISLARWNSHYLIPLLNPANTATDSTPVVSFTAPDWVLLTGQGPNPAPPPNAVIGRYAFGVYDEGGLLDMSLAGYPNTWGTVSSGGPPGPTPTPWPTNVGRKGILTFADLTALPVTQPQMDNIAGWRNFATTQQTASFGASNQFSTGNQRNRQNAYGSYLLDFGDPPFTDPSNYPFTTVDPSTTSAPSRTDQAVMTRQELLKLRSSLGFGQGALQYMGTFSRERNKPAPDWPRLNGHLPDRYDITNLGLIKPNPDLAVVCRGQGHGNGNGQGCYKGRGRFRGTPAQIRNLFGLVFVLGDTAVTDPHQLAYWDHWLYVGIPGMPTNCDPGQGCDHIPALRGGSTDFFQILDYGLTQANGDTDDTTNAADVLGLGASLIDQYDFSGNPSNPAGDDAAPRTNTHTTIIAYNGGFVLGWENNEVKAALDPTDINPLAPHNPYNWITNDGTSTGAKKAPPGFTPIVLDHAFTTVGEFGYGLRTAYAPNPFQRIDFHTANSNAPLLDFFTYNPVGNAYPRLGIVNLNTKNVPVIAAILQSTLKKDVDVTPLPNPFPIVSSSEASLAAQDIVNATNTQAALNRADIGRLTAAAASRILNPGGYTGEQLEKLPEAISRALSEIGQARTWNLMIDVVAQTGKYKPNAPDLTASNFIVEGEKRYWLHIALGRDLVSGSVDVLGTQLEEVTE